MEESLSRTSSGILVSSQSRAGSVRTGTTRIKSKILNFKTLIIYFWSLWKKLHLRSRVFLACPTWQGWICVGLTWPHGLFLRRGPPGLSKASRTHSLHLQKKHLEQCNLWRVCWKTCCLPGKLGLSLLESGSENINQYFKNIIPFTAFYIKMTIVALYRRHLKLYTILNTTVVKLTSRTDIYFCRFM